MNTTNELPPQNTEQKLDAIIQLVNEFRSSLLGRMDGLDAQLESLRNDARERYVDLRQRMEKLDERVTGLEEGQTEIRQNLKLLEKYFHLLDRKVGNLVEETGLWKERVRELETTRPLH